MIKNVRNSKIKLLLCILLVISFSEFLAAEKLFDTIVNIAGGSSCGILNNINFGSVRGITKPQDQEIVETTQGEYAVKIMSNGNSDDINLKVLFQKPKDDIPIISAQMFFCNEVNSLMIKATTLVKKLHDQKIISKSNQYDQLLEDLENSKQSFYFLLTTTTHLPSEETHWWKFDVNKINFKEIRKNTIFPTEEENSSCFSPVIFASAGLAALILLLCIFKHYK